MDEPQSDILILGMVGNEVVQQAVTISPDQAVQRAELEYAKYKAQTKGQISRAEEDFVQFISHTDQSLKNTTKN